MTTIPKHEAPDVSATEDKLGIHRILDAERLLTPALAIYPSIVDANIDAVLRILEGDPQRWRPHVKTAKLLSVMRRLIERGITNFKCATTLELLTACEAGAQDVLIAYPCVGARALRVGEIADRFPSVSISALVEDATHVKVWKGSRVGLFIDINPGMNRTGIQQERDSEIIEVAGAILSSALPFRGVHYYDGHQNDLDVGVRTRAAHRGYDRLLEITRALAQCGFPVQETITSGTPSLLCALSYAGFKQAGFVHRVSPGTLIYNDVTSLKQLPAAYGLAPAVVIVATVVSHPAPNIVTCDAGHKTVSVDCGVPNCEVLGRPDLVPLAPSEEHLPIEVPAGAVVPAIGEMLYLVPRHVCPTLNNFDHALIVRGGRITGVESVTARGREAPIPGSMY
jgi:D-serine deaminase-like pyridoxal phosphate-dependent protein